MIGSTTTEGRGAAAARAYGTCREGRHPVRLAVTFALLLPCAAIAAQDAAARTGIHEGPGGVTCDFLDGALQLPWLVKGGDWTDAKGEAQGAAAYAQARVKAVNNPLPVELDVTALVQKALKEGSFPGILVAGKSGGEIVIASRENKDASRQPELVLSTSSGTPLRLAPRADTYIDCTSNSSLGKQEVMRVSENQVAILDFDLGPAAGARIDKAVLRLHPINLYGRDAQLSVFRLGGRASEAAAQKQTGLASGVREDQLARRQDVLFVEGFDDGDWTKRWSVLGPQSKATAVDSDASFRPLNGKALKVTIPAGKNMGLDLRYRFREKLGYEPDEAYLRYYVYFPDSWETPVDGGKLPGLSGTYGKAGWGGRTPNGYNGWNMRMLFMRQPPVGHPMHDTVTVGTEASIPEVPGFQKEGHFAWANARAGVLEKNRWYCIEQYVKLNTPDGNDGVVRGWVDGRLAFERTNVVYRRTPELKIEEAWMNVYHGGQSPTPRDISMYIDNVVVAKQYIGPMKTD